MFNQSYECSIAHDCKARGVSRCATCELGAGHLLVKPVQLECGDFACQRCTRGSTTVECKTHGRTSVMLALDSDFTDNKTNILKCLEITLRNAISLRNGLLRALFEWKKYHFKAYFQESKDYFRKNLRTSVQNVKFEIDMRIDEIKESLDLMRDDLYTDLDDKEDAIIK